MKNNRSASFGLLHWMLPVLLLAMIFAFTATPPAQAAPPATIELSAFTLPDGGILLAQIDAPAAAPSDATAITTPEASTLSWQQAIIPLLTPILVAGIKKVLPKIPSVWIPVIAATLGAVGSVIDHFATGATLNMWLGVGLGLAGVGVREATKQLKQAAGYTPVA